MNIFQLFTKNNIETLKLIDKERLHIRDIADRLKISPGSVHKLVKLLKSNDLATETKVKNRSIVNLKYENPIIRKIKSMINFNDLINAPAYNKLKKVGNVGVYGSFADGTNDKESDLDIWIMTDKKEMELRPLIHELERQIGIKVNPLILSDSKIKSLKKNDPEFYTRLVLTSEGDHVD